MSRPGSDTLYLLTAQYLGAGELGERVQALLASCGAARVQSATSATFVVGFGSPDEWPALSGQLQPRARTFVWFEHLTEAEEYALALERLPSALFLHGEVGLTTLERLLVGHGLSEEFAAVDVAGADGLFELKGTYLRQLVANYRTFLDDRPPTEPALSAAWTDFLHRIEGSAGTYEFAELSDAARRAKALFGVIPAPEENEDAAAQLMADAINAAVEDHREQIAARLPERIAHEIRHRALILSTDAALGQQLRLALAHSRLEALVHDDPSTFYDALRVVQPDVIAIQQELEHFDGFDLVAQIRADPAFAALPIVGVLEDISESSRTRAARCGVDTWIVRPFSAENALQTVEACLRRLDAQTNLGGRDPVTGLQSHRAMRDRIDVELMRARRTGELVALMLIHIETTDPRRHPREQLVDLARTVESSFRRSDTLARHNDRTIAAVLAGAEPRIVATLIDRLLAATDATIGLRVAASIGDGAVTTDLLVADAEHRLMQALEGSPTAAVGRCASAEAESSPVRAHAARVLLVDSDEAILNLLRFFCAREGLVVEEARDGLGAIEHLERAARTQTLPDLVVMEAYLPGVDGFSVLRRIQSEYGGRVAVMMLTIQRNEERIAKAFKLGAADFVAKPFSVPEVMARIKNILLRSGAL
ncbi:MAG: response regulator [Myxococcales bacterium]|nr:response regulator [Myxococcales bacterium]MCB9520876.1 response regulator [Myxococcales bacterium]MCB9532230.1 response regulator [Myxococcales bacterium]